MSFRPMLMAVKSAENVLLPLITRNVAFYCFRSYHAPFLPFGATDSYCDKS